MTGKCHHMMRAVAGDNDPKFWTRASRGELVDEDWKEFIKWLWLPISCWLLVLSFTDQSSYQRVLTIPCLCTGRIWPGCIPMLRFCSTFETRRSGTSQLTTPSDPSTPSWPAWWRCHWGCWWGWEDLTRRWLQCSLVLLQHIWVPSILGGWWECSSQVRTLQSGEMLEKTTFHLNHIYNPGSSLTGWIKSSVRCLLTDCWCSRCGRDGSHSVSSWVFLFLINHSLMSMIQLVNYTNDADDFVILNCCQRWRADWDQWRCSACVCGVWPRQELEWQFTVSKIRYQQMISSTSSHRDFISCNV